MNNNSRMVSASEVNRFCYCNYQWYYERVYGLSYMRKAKIKRNPKSKRYKSKKVSPNANFKRGNDFHNTYMRNERRRRLFRLFIMLIVIVVIATLVIFFYKNYPDKFDFLSDLLNFSSFNIMK